MGYPPNQSRVPNSYEEFGDACRIRPFALDDWILDVMVQMVRFTILLRPHAERLVDHYSEPKEADRVIYLEENLLAITLSLVVRTAFERSALWRGRLDCGAKRTLVRPSFQGRKINLESRKRHRTNASSEHQRIKLLK